jgi:hypothetical protein
VVGVDRVAAAGEVQVAAAVGRVEHVEGLVAEALEVHAPGRPGPALGGVVEDHVEQHADAGAVQGLDHVAELAPVRARDGSTQ